MRYSITRRFRRSPQRQSVIGVAPQKNGRGINTHANPTDPEVDIIFVHGLDGGSFSSWAKNEDPRLYWPKEWLPKEMELSRARIHTYGYNLDPRRDLNSYWDFAGQFLTDLICSPLWFGTLPIILVGHSTGGLVIKKAYILSVFSQIYNRISCAIQSFIFLSTPHKPLDAHSFKKWRKINPCLTSKSAMDSTLAFLTDQFQRVHRNKRILNFVEAKSTSLRRGHKKVVVCSHETSVMGFPQEIVVPLTASHNSISKFKSPNDTNYATFYRHLASALREIREVRDEQPTAPPAYTPQTTYVPHSAYIPHSTYIPQLTYIPPSTHIPHWAPQPAAVQTHSTGQQRRRYVPAEWR